MFRVATIAACMFLLTPRAMAQLPVLETFVTGLQQPVLLTHAGDGSDRKFIVEQAGRILVVQPGSTTPTVFLDIRSRVLSGGERGLLGLAFHPQYAANGRLFVNYTRQIDGATVIAEYRVIPGNPNAADAAEEIVLLVIAQPFSNHNGGMIEFGPDNFLYIGTGDGGSANDPDNRAQNVEDLLGKILRIDVNNPASPSVPYSSPSSNPFFGSVAGRDEIFALGFRNPWRFSFDRLNGQMYAGDVGQNTREEVDIVTRGGNYGWRVFEGTHCTGLGPAPCANFPSIPPIAEYMPGELGRCAVTAGYVYRGSRRSLPYGAYVFADFCSGEIFLYQGGVTSILTDTNAAVSSFGEDEAGEIYVVDLAGAISRLTSGAFSSTTSVRSFAVPNRGAVFLPATSTSSTPASGYVRIQADPGDSLPGGLAILQVRPQGVLVSEVAIPDSPLMQSGRTLAWVSSTETTRIAIANPNPFEVTINFHFTNDAGQDYGHQSLRIPANRQVSGFLDESPFNGGERISGTFTFQAAAAVSVIAIRGAFNERSEVLMSLLPVTPINTAPSNRTFFPHRVLGDGWASEFLVINPAEVLISGLIVLTDPLGAVVETLSYTVPSRSSRRLIPATQSQTLRTGAARIVVTAGTVPAAAVIYRYRAGTSPAAETIDPAIAPGTAFRGFGEFSAVTRTGLAVANASSQAVTVNVQIRTLSGGLRDTAQFDLPGFGQKSIFLDELPGFGTGIPFQGTVEVNSLLPIVATVVRTRVNERGEFLVASMPPDNTADVNLSVESYFPIFAVGGDAQTEFILMNAQASGTASGDMLFLTPNGKPFSISVP
jgi:glucose/arabinose dehydrogenase